MQSPRPSLPTRRVSRTRAVTQPLSPTQTRHLQQLSDESSLKKTANRPPNGHHPYASDIINVQSFLKIHSSHARQQYHKNKTSVINDRITINVCGDRYETNRTTLELYPNTLLGNPKRRKYYYDHVHNEYFFDRHRACFSAILYYYQSNGRLRRPDYVSLDVFLEEVTFFQLGQEALNQIRKDENIKEVRKVHLPKNRLRKWLWATMEYPGYSVTAKIVNVLSLIMVLISTVALAAESLPQYAHLDDLNCHKQQKFITNMSNLNQTTTLDTSEGNYVCQWYFTSPFIIIQAICVVYFTIELLLRTLTTPSLLNFLKNLMNWIDLAAVVPFYITIGIRLVGREDEINTDTYTGLRLLRVLRLVRVFKFCRVFKSIKSVRVLASTIRQSLVDFLIVLIILSLLSFLFGAAAYYAENDINSNAFDSIPKATYWGIITITSVGYGDIAPVSVIGRIIGCLCALFGAATTGMLMSILVEQYQRVYARKLYYQEEQIDFGDDSDEEDDDKESKNLTNTSEHCHHPKIEDPDARAQQTAMQADNSSLHQQVEENNRTEQDSNQIHFIIGYVDSDKHKSSRDLIDRINSIVADKQASGDNISLSLVSNQTTQETRPFDVRFELDTSDGDDNDDDLNEITKERRSRKTMCLKHFIVRPRQTNDRRIALQRNV